MKFDRKLRGEILKIERREIEDFTWKFAVKLRAVCKRLIFNDLQKQHKTARFVKYFYQFFPMPLSTAKREFTFKPTLCVKTAGNVFKTGFIGGGYYFLGAKGL